jgi:hypothetical protein
MTGSFILWSSNMQFHNEVMGGCHSTTVSCSLEISAEFSTFIPAPVLSNISADLLLL